MPDDLSLSAFSWDNQISPTNNCKMHLRVHHSLNFGKCFRLTTGAVLQEKRVFALSKKQSGSLQHRRNKCFFALTIAEPWSQNLLTKMARVTDSELRTLYGKVAVRPSASSSLNFLRKTNFSMIHTQLRFTGNRSDRFTMIRIRAHGQIRFQSQ